MGTKKQTALNGREVLSLAAERAIKYADGVRQRRVAAGARELEGLARFRETFPEGPTDAESVVAMLDEFGSPATVATTGGRYFGYVIGGVLPAALGANWLAGAWDQNAALRAMSPIAAELEEVVLRWICEALNLPGDCEGGLVTCATAANFTALAAARYALLRKAGWDVAEDGMFGAPPIEVVVGAEVHASALKALSLVGFGKRRVTIVESDSQGRMRWDKLPKLSERAIVCIQAGNVNSGSFDPAAEICRRAQEQGAWVHVDGAFGLWAGVSPRYRHLTEGFQLADSALRAAMTLSAAYLAPGTRREPMHHTPEASRRARGVELWAGLKSLGRSGLCDLIERTCSLAKRFESGLLAAGFQVLNEVVINQVLVAFGDDAVTREVIRRIQEDGTCWCGATEWKGKTAMRISVSSWVTREGDVDRSLEAMVRIARACGA